MRRRGRFPSGTLTRSPSLAALALITGVSPFATDTYVAALPQVRRSLATGSTTAQLTMTTFILGLAAGQLVCGPISDGLGRRRLLLVASPAFTALSAACGLAPSAGLLLAARTLQGFAGGCSVAVGRAVVSDRYTGPDAAARYGTLASITLLAPVLAPAVGGLILTVGDWRTVFGFLTLLGVVMSVAVLIGIPETLPPERRSTSGPAETGRRMAGLARRPAFVTVVAAQCLATAGFFVYIGGSSIVLQDQLRLDPSRYSLLFAVNATAMAAASVVFRIGVRRVGPARLRTVGLVTSATAATALAGYGALAGDAVRLAPVWVLLAVAVAGMGLTIPATTAMAQEIGRDVGGTASALTGGTTFVVGALATPLTGLTGLTTVTGMAFLMAVPLVAAVAVQLAGGSPSPAAAVPTGGGPG